MSPTYETEKDRANESGIIPILAAYGLVSFPLPQYAPCDFLSFSRGGGGYLVEFKCRRNKSTKYPSVMIPESKLRKCLTIAEQLKLDFLYVVQFDDGVFITDAKEYSTAIGGRKDRNDPRDMGRMAYIDINRFRKIR